MREICSYGSVGVPVGDHRHYPEMVGRWGGGLLFAEDLEDDLGGDAVGVVAVGEDAANGATPAPEAELFPGMQGGFLEQRVPVGFG